MNAFKGAKGCFVLKLCSAIGAIPDLQHPWVLAPDHVLQKFWPVSCKFCTWSLHFLWGKRDLWGCIKINTEWSNSLKMWQQTAHLYCNFRLLISPAALSSFLSTSLSSISLSPPLLCDSPLLVTLSITERRWGMFFFRFPCIVSTHKLWKAFPIVSHVLWASSLPSSESSGPSLFHPLSLTPAVSSRMPRTLPCYASLTNLGQSFWAKRISSASSSACRGPTWGMSIRFPRGRWTKGQASTMAFRVSMHLASKTSMNSGEKSSVGGSSRPEKAEASSLSRFIPASSRSLGGVQTLILTLLQKECCGYCQGTRHPFQARNEYTLDYLPTLQRNLLRAKVTALAGVEVSHLAHITLWAQWSQSYNSFPTGLRTSISQVPRRRKGNH